MARARECVVEVGRCVLQELSSGLSAERFNEFLSLLALTRLCSVSVSLNGLRAAASSSPTNRQKAASTQKSNRQQPAAPNSAIGSNSAFASNAHPEAPFHELYYVAESALALYCSRLGNLFAQFNGAVLEFSSQFAAPLHLNHLDLQHP